MANDFLEFNNLSETERQLALKILEQYAENGRSEILQSLKEADFNEMPVDIMTFITDDRYLGKAWKNTSGKLKMYPYWQDKLKELFPDNLTTSVNNVILSGARGLGKSEIAVTAGIYLMHRVMCMKNPHEYFSLKATEKIAFAFMNITKELAEEIGVTKFQSTVQMSPWFLEHGTLSGRDNVVWNPPNNIKIIVGSQASHVIGQPIFFAMFDEISFIRNQDIEKQKAIAIDMIDTAIGGMKTRFLFKGKNPTLLALCSSKRSEKSFLETHTKSKLKAEKENVLVVDEAVWDVKPADTYSGTRFYVALGNKYLASEIIPKDQYDNLKAYQDRGYKILNVPIEFYSEFFDNIDRALCDYAGISSSDLVKFISGVRLLAVKNKQRQNLFTKDEIEVGNAPDDIAQYYDFIDMNRLDRRLLHYPLFIHLDMSISGDKTGIAGVWIAGKKPHQEGIPDSRELFFKVAFSVSVKAPRGYQVSFEKNRQFIYWLRDAGFNIAGVSSDTYQNADLAQQLVAQGFNYKVISVDRVNSDHICEPYQYLRNTIYEGRVDLYDECPLLTTELTQLEKNSNGKVDHPDEGRTGSKDQADALCGACYYASQHAEKFAYDYGEGIETSIKITAEPAVMEDALKQQVGKAFEDALIEAYNPMQRVAAQHRDSHFMDFGVGKAQPISQIYANDGIFIW